MNFLQRFAANPNKRWAEFKLGLGIFVFAAILIFVGARFWVWLQIPALILLATGSIIAAKGYLGILIFRLSNSFNKTKPPVSLFDKDR